MWLEKRCHQIGMPSALDHIRKEPTKGPLPDGGCIQLTCKARRALTHFEDFCLGALPRALTGRYPPRKSTELISTM